MDNSPFLAYFSGDFPNQISIPGNHPLSQQLLRLKNQAAVAHKGCSPALVADTACPVTSTSHGETPEIPWRQGVTIRHPSRPANAMHIGFTSIVDILERHWRITALGYPSWIPAIHTSQAYQFLP